MRQNPPFNSNFSDGNMSQSVKLADYGSSDYEINARKQFMKYAGGHYEQTQERQKPQNMLPGTKPIKTEHSQVDGLQIGFKKLKDNQMQYLKQLRNQFVKIQNIQGNERKEQPKLSSSDSQSRGNRGNQESSSSISSQRIIKKDHNVDHRQQRLWQLQRKQYQIALTNCQLKLEQLLHNEMEYKKMIHELRSNNLASKGQPVDNKFQSQIKQLQKQLKQQKQKNYRATNQLQKIKASNKQLTEKLSRIESQNSYKAKDEGKLVDQKRKLQQYLRLEKDKFMNCEIERRKFQMEVQLLNKQKDQEVNRIQKQLQHQNVLHELNVKNSIKKFEDEIQIKDRRYMLLLSQYQKLKRDHADVKAKAETQKNHHHHHSNQNQFIQIMKALIEQRRNPQNEQLAKTINNLIQKLERQSESSSSSNQSSIQINHLKPTEHQQKLLTQIRILKAQVQALKGNSGDGIDLEPMKKMYEAEVAALKDTIAVLQRKLKNIPRDTPSSPSQEKPFNNIISQRTIIQLQKRIAELESQRLNNTQKTQSQQKIKNERKKLQRVEQQLRNITRRKNQAEFQISKLQKQIQFRINILKNQKQTQLRIKQAELDRSNVNIGYWKTEFQNMRNFYEQRLAEKNRQLQQYLNSTQIQQIKKTYSQGLDQAKTAYQKQARDLAERLAGYQKQLFDYDTLQRRYNALELAYLQLQQSILKSKQTNDGVDHLWQVKETQYNNVNYILRQMGVQARPQSAGISTSQHRQITSSLAGGLANLFGRGSQFGGATTVINNANTTGTAYVDPRFSYADNNGYNRNSNISQSQANAANLGAFNTIQAPPSPPPPIVDPYARNTVYSNSGPNIQNSSFSNAGVQPAPPLDSRGSYISQTNDARISNFGYNTADVRNSNFGSAVPQPPAPIDSYNQRISNTSFQDPRMSSNQNSFIL